MRLKISLIGLAAILAVLLFVSLAPAKDDKAAGVSIYKEETITTYQFPGNKQSTMTTRAYIKGNKMRNESGDGSDVTILRPDLDLVYTINTARKMYAESPLSIYRKAVKLSLMMMGADPNYKVTGREKTIGSYKCREIVIADESTAGGDKMQTIWWVSEDPRLEKNLMRHTLSLSLGNDMDPVIAKVFEKISGIPGYPVQTETTMTRGGMTVRSVNTLKKMEKREITDSLFELPEGMTKMVMPVPDGMQ